MATIEKKILSKEFEEMKSGKKKYELRLGDFKINEGDTLVLKEWDKEKQEYTGRELAKKVTFVGATWKPYEIYWSKEEIDKYGFQIISLE